MGEMGRHTGDLGSGTLSRLIKQFSLALGAGLGVVLLASSTAWAIPFTGTPSCDGAGNCSVAVNQAINQSAPVTLEVDFDNNQHIELFDLDDNLQIIRIDLGITNLSLTDSAFVIFGMELTDMNGDAIPDTQFSFGNLLPANSSNGIWISNIIPLLPNEVLFHDFNLGVTTAFGAVDVGTFSGVGFLNFDAASNVGVWAVPEPPTLALFVIALGGLGFMMRRRVV